MKTLSIGYSPCPNDTFIFYGLTHGVVNVDGVAFAKEILADVETLNSWALEGRLDVTKLSFHALGHVLDKYVLLSAGAALGRGCGPLLVTAGQGELSSLAGLKIAVPGAYTTAAMLLRMFAPECADIVIMRFDEIMPAIRAGAVDAGVIIHESRFTYQSFGLKLIRDLGEWWNEMSGYPIPLGGIAVKRSLGTGIIAEIDAAVRRSVRWAFSHPEQTSGYVKSHAQEMAEDVVAAHIGLYVNSFSENLGEEGAAAIDFLLRKGREVGVLPSMSNETLLGPKKP